MLSAERMEHVGEQQRRERRESVWRRNLKKHRIQKSLAEMDRPREMEQLEMTPLGRKKC
ncbi:hypothetical protein KSZ_51880 [Dictyobacter formicarum]|uniref:Uncharacterized protein n=1 Tax=Dictyobacter formicarum TaxID=2778368 RepID=A0ABQ3VLU2_9CHLR|nr:hypothetical protein KSZ_51880 [Dictyobacter formicarum]